MRSIFALNAVGFWNERMGKMGDTSRGTFPAELAHNAAITRVRAGAKRRSKDVHVR